MVYGFGAGEPVDGAAGEAGAAGAVVEPLFGGLGAAGSVWVCGAVVLPVVLTSRLPPS